LRRVIIYQHTINYISADDPNRMDDLLITKHMKANNSNKSQ